MKKRDVSIIIPVYNASKYLRRCLDSVLAQTFSDFEVILIDDGSTDDSGVICDDYTKDVRFRVIHQKNFGVSRARNVGIQESIGKYIVFVDADDYLNPTMLQRMLEVVRHHDECDVVLCGSTAWESRAIKQYDDFLEFIAFNEIWAPWAKMFKRDRIKVLFDERYSIGEDLWFCYQNSKTLKNFLYIPAKLYVYRKNSGSAMKRRELRLSDLSCLDIVLKIIEDPNIKEELRIFFMAYYIKMYYYIFTKRIPNSVTETKKKSYLKNVGQFYRVVKERKMLNWKLFIQVRLTPLYSLLARMRR